MARSSLSTVCHKKHTTRVPAKLKMTAFSSGSHSLGLSGKASGKIVYYLTTCFTFSHERQQKIFLLGIGPLIGSTSSPYPPTFSPPTNFLTLPVYLSIYISPFLLSVATVHLASISDWGSWTQSAIVASENFLPLLVPFQGRFYVGAEADSPTAFSSRYDLRNFGATDPDPFDYADSRILLTMWNGKVGLLEFL